MQRQFRSKQFSADIIDSVVGRIGEVMVPIPKDAKRLARIEAEAKTAILGRAEARAKLAYAFRAVDSWLQGEKSPSLEDIFSWQPAEKHEGVISFLGYRTPHVSFEYPAKAIRHDILIPKYYDPTVAKIAMLYHKHCDLVKVSELAKTGELTLETGDEIGKMSYGTGDIPFVRTSDLASWELKREAKQGISEEIYDQWKPKQDVKAGDVLLIRDGTYLVGSSVLLFSGDLPLLFGGNWATS